MGVFSRRKAYAQVSSPRLYTDLPNLPQQAVMSSIVSGRDMVNTMNMSRLQGPVRALRRVRSYANGSYAYGPPTITTSLDSALSPDEAWMTELPSRHTLSNTATEVDRIVITESLKEFVGVAGDATYLEAEALYGNPIALPDVYAMTTNIAGTITVWATDGVTPYIHLTVPNPALTDIEHYVKYDIVRTTYVLDGGGLVLSQSDAVIDTVHASYNEALNTIPLLHDTDITTIANEALPLIPVRLNGLDWNAGLANSDSINTMLKKIQINPQEIVDAIKDNPDEADIDDVFVGFGIGLNETEEWAVAGLANSFEFLHSLEPNSLALHLATGERQSINYTEAAGEFNNKVAYNYITTSVGVGSPGFTKTYTAGTPTTVTVPNPYYVAGSTVPSEVEENITSITGSDNEYVFTKNIGTTGTFMTITVNGLVNSHQVSVPGFGYREVSFENEEEGLVLPLFNEIIGNTPIRLRDDLIYGSMRLFIYAYQVIKLAWYQTAFFQGVLALAAIAFAVFTYGATLVSAFGTSAIAGVLAIAEIIAVGAIIDYGVQWLVEEVGGPLALLLAVVLTTATGSFSSMTISFNTSWMNLFTSAVKVYGEFVTAELGTIQDQQAAFTLGYEERMNDIDAAVESMEWGAEVNMLDVGEYRSMPNTTPYEAPQEFYNRTTTTIDLPSMSNAMISKYHEAQLKLPEPDSYLPTHNFNTGYNNAAEFK